ncbi:Mitogen-activated protein kinase kinase kinase 2 [Carex littledalei]|uniref:Mitogen-activated protein kinase kinase kinase 2 n=1 Tax=Carex littledalei TaxID=544730 RepID=A0A833RB97_9POAL|nr:Mitogen-activated protein kinase kinase kinase 2 [Carex littledalei]
MEIQKWRRGGILGCGSFATVSIATNYTSGESVAVKSVPLCRAEVLRREQSILSSLDSPFIISYLGSDVFDDPCTKQLCYNILLEYAPGGSLADEVKRQHGRLPESSVRSRTFEILSGLVYLHDIGIVHCDIKGHNVLIGSDGHAKIADFGCAKSEFCKFSGSQIRGTPMYMAPEVARGEEQRAPADMWALGCTVLEIMSGGFPWAGFSDPVSVLHHIGYSSDVPVVPNWISEEAKDFLSKCLIRDPDKRWSAEQLINHPFVASSENSPSEKSAVELRVSPKSILDQEIWESLTLDVESESVERFKVLAGGTVSGLDWSNDGDWIMVRCKSEDAFVTDVATTASSVGGEEVNLCGGHMQTEGFQFNPHGCDFVSSNNDCLEGGQYKNNCTVSDCSSDLLKRRKELNIRFLIGYPCLLFLHFLIFLLLIF